MSSRDRSRSRRTPWACATVTSRGAGWWCPSGTENWSATCERILRPWTAGCLVVVIGLAGCGGGTTTKASEAHAGYPQGIQQSFLASCERSAQVDKATYCRCLLAKLEARYSQVGFETLSNKERLATVKSIASQCAPRPSTATPLRGASSSSKEK